MSIVSAEFLARWRQQVQALVGGDAQRLQVPVTRAYIRDGYFRHENAPWTGPEINAVVVGGDNDNPWQKTYDPSTDWIELPQVLATDLEGSFENKGNASTIVIENTLLVEESGFSGLYHLIERGWLSPWRGSETEFTPPATQEPNEWFRLLDQKLQIKVWQGYGEDEIVPTFLGFIDDLDLTSRPGQIVITARDASQIPSDQRFYGWSKEVSHPDPVTFADRQGAAETTRVGLSPVGSSEQVTHEATNVNDGDQNTRWLSDDSVTTNYTEWVEVEIPAGTYNTFRVNTDAYAGMAMYVSVYSVNGEIDGVPVTPDGWIDTGLGGVPGVNGGIPYVKLTTTIDGAKVVRLPFSYVGDAGSKVRVSFRDLKLKGSVYRAGVTSLMAIQQPAIETVAGTEGWILVDDVSDIVRLILRWSGFKEWYVEDANMRLKDKWTVNRESFLMDMIDTIAERTGFSFFIADPDENDDSLGYPIFRLNRALYELDADEIPSITESDMLTDARPRFTMEPLSHIIRVRGRLATKDEGGIVVSRDARRLVAVYRPPPWRYRTASIYRRTFLDRFDLKTQNALEYAARLVALKQALAAGTVTIQIPANPGIELDQHIMLVDTSTGLNTRVWTAQRSSHYVGGDEPSWTMTLGGALLDTPMMEAMREEVLELVDGADD